MIAILMATYNGESYLREQLESLLSQTYQNFVIYISDDLSTDSTYNILQNYKKKYPTKIVVFQNNSGHHGAKHNFMQLMIHHKADYVMLCDQDDVWKPEKIEITLRKMHELEGKYGKETPILVHTDLEVVNQSLQTISPSLKKAMNVDYSRTQLRQIIIQNTLTGCTALYNRALSDLIAVEPPYMIMHDWWLILVASAFGIVGHVDEKTILYRQHRENVIGAKDVRTFRYKMRKLLNWRSIERALDETYRQAESLIIIYGDRLTAEQMNLLRAYCSIPTKNKLCRCITIYRLKMLKHGIARKIAHLIFI